jgi:hypothetical protein
MLTHHPGSRSGRERGREQAQATPNETPPTSSNAQSMIVTAYLLQIRGPFPAVIGPLGPQSRGGFGEIVRLSRIFTA